VHLVGFIKKKFVTMHGHMNVKNFLLLSSMCNIFLLVQGFVIKNKILKLCE